MACLSKGLGRLRLDLFVPDFHGIFDEPLENLGHLLPGPFIPLDYSKDTSLTVAFALHETN